jgi:hypothetical protein
MLTPIQSLKIRLMTEGMSLAPEARARLSGEDGCRPITLHDYATTSGISMRLPGDLWVNAPMRDYNPNFVQDPCAVLDVDDAGFVLRTGELSVRAEPLPVPAYHDKLNTAGEPYIDYAITHTDRVRISPIAGCDYTCQFCDLPYKMRYRRKRIDGFIEAIATALTDPALPARHVMISGGTPRQADFDYLNELYEKVVASFPGIEVDVMMTPVPGLLDVAWLDRLGVHELSINLEMWDESLARRYMPKKAKLTRDYFLGFCAEAAEILGGERVRSILLLGLEPAESTLAAVEALAARGCVPVLSPFRPDPATPLHHIPPPNGIFLTEVYERARDICDRYGVKLGPTCAPCQHNTLTFPA